MPRYSNLPAETQGVKSRFAFTLIEILIVITIIGVMSTLILSSISNATQDSREVVSRQQQVVLQEALNAWIAQASSGTNGLAAAMTQYATATTDLAKLTLIRNYLHGETYRHFTSYSGTNTLRSEAMMRANLSVRFSSNWSATNYPSVELY